MPALSPAALDRRDRALDRLILAWEGRAEVLIRGRVDDAAAHASKAITATLAATPDGRPTVLRAARNPSARAADARLVELWAALCGPSSASLDGLARDAWEAAYRAGLASWAAILPGEHLKSDAATPSQSRLAAARRIVIRDDRGAYELRQEFAGPIATARRHLAAAIAAAGHSDARGATHIAAWAARVKDSLILTARGAIDYGCRRADMMAGRDVHKPELLIPVPELDG